MAVKATDRGAEIAVVNTPVRSGHMRTSWFQRPVQKVTYALWQGYQGVIENSVDYAAYVENGTGIWGPKHAPYVILPKHAGLLAWRDPHTGHWIHAKKVIHPGSPGNHMTAIACAVVEAELDSGALVAGIMDLWVRQVEGSAD